MKRLYICEMSTTKNNLMDLPPEIVQHVLSYVSFETIAKLRPVSKAMNSACERMLNNGFLKAQKFHASLVTKVKGLLPRRESERCGHKMWKHMEALTAVETRLSLLGMTYWYYIDIGLCCFIPGKVIDELLSVLRIIDGGNNLKSSYEFLVELKDISSMAMDHFEEKNIRALKQKFKANETNHVKPNESSVQTVTELALITTQIAKLFKDINSLKRSNTLLKRKLRQTTQARKTTRSIRKGNYRTRKVKSVLNAKYAIRIIKQLKAENEALRFSSRINKSEQIYKPSVWQRGEVC